MRPCTTTLKGGKPELVAATMVPFPVSGGRFGGSLTVSSLPNQRSSILRMVPSASSSRMAREKASHSSALSLEKR